MTDPIVQEVRAARMAHAKRFNYDLSAICSDLRNIEKRCGHRLVSLEPKRIQPTSRCTALDAPSSRQ